MASIHDSYMLTKHRHNSCTNSIIRLSTVLFFITYTLVELSVASQCHSWLVSAVHSVNVVALDLLNLVHCYVASKGHLTSKGGKLVKEFNMAFWGWKIFFLITKHHARKF